MLEEKKETEILEEIEDEEEEYNWYSDLPKKTKDKIFNDLLKTELSNGCHGWENFNIEEMKKEMSKNEFNYTLFAESAIRDDYREYIVEAYDTIDFTECDLSELQEEVITAIRRKFNYWGN